MSNAALIFLEEAENVMQLLGERYGVRFQSLDAGRESMLVYRNETTVLKFMWEQGYPSGLWMVISPLEDRVSDGPWVDPALTSSNLDFILQMKGLSEIGSDLGRWANEDDFRLRMRTKLREHLEALREHAEGLLLGNFADLEAAIRWRDQSPVGD